MRPASASAETPPHACPRPKSSGWWGYVDSRARSRQDGNGGGPAGRPASSSAFMAHALHLLSAPTLDVDVVSHCNLNCASCYHFSPIARPRFLSRQSYERDLELLARVEGADAYFRGIFLMGGEPLLHPELPELVLATRRHLPTAKLRITSNGLLLRSMGPEFWDALRGAGCKLILTPYPIGLDYEGLIALARSHGVEAGMAGGSAEGDAVSRFLRTPLDEEGLQDRTASFNSCPLGGCCLQLLDGKIFPCNRGALLGIVNERFGTEFTHDPDDYLELSALCSVEDIDRMRRRAHPMCRYCATSLDERIAWQRSTATREEWLLRADERQLLEAPDAGEARDPR